MNYFNIYSKIIKRAITRNVTNINLEKHHIVPKSLGGIDDNINIAKLTTREHYLCHMLLIKMLSGLHRRKMAYALWWMSKSRNGKNKKIVTSRQYESAKNIAIDAYKNDQTRIDKIKKAHIDGKFKDSASKVGAQLKKYLSKLTDEELKHRMANSAGKCDQKKRGISIKKGKSSEYLLLKTNGEQNSFFSYDNIEMITGYDYNHIKYRIKRYNGLLINGDLVLVVKKYNGNDKNIGRKRNNNI
jgi:hypothetical protein